MPVKEGQDKAQANGHDELFTVADIPDSVPVSMHFPKMFPGKKPFEFQLRMELSKEAKERRAKFSALSAAERTERERAQAVDELCDLLVEPPKGFGDFPAQAQGETLYDVALRYFNQKPLLQQIAEAANTAYYNTVLPREFHP